MTDDIASERLAEMLAATEKAMPGPWSAEGRGPNMTLVFAGDSGVKRLTPVMAMDGDQAANLAHIANCDPQTVAAIIRELLSYRERAKA